jgi:hypothetical protein
MHTPSCTHHSATTHFNREAQLIEVLGFRAVSFWKNWQGATIAHGGSRPLAGQPTTGRGRLTLTSPHLLGHRHS